MTPKGKLLRTVFRRAPGKKIVKRRKNKIISKLFKRSSPQIKQVIKTLSFILIINQ